MELIFKTKNGKSFSLTFSMEELARNCKHEKYQAVNEKTKKRRGTYQTSIVEISNSTKHSITMVFETTITEVSKSKANIKEDIFFDFRGETFHLLDAINLISLEEFIEKINKGENVTINDVYILFFYLNKKGKKIEFCYNMPIVKKETEYQVQRLESVKVTPDFIDRGSGYMPSSYMVVRPVLGRDRGEYKILDRKISLFELYEKICDGAIEFTII